MQDELTTRVAHKHLQICQQNIVKQWFWVLTNVWRRCGEGVALILSAAVDKESTKGSEALLPVVTVGETAPLFKALHPGVEADVSSARSILACAFVIFACAQQFIIVTGVD